MKKTSTPYPPKKAPPKKAPAKKARATTKKPVVKAATGGLMSRMELAPNTASAPARPSLSGVQAGDFGQMFGRGIADAMRSYRGARRGKSRGNVGGRED